MKNVNVEFAYLERLNETEQLMIFQRKMKGKYYGLDIVLNTALPIEVQDLQINKVVQRLIEMKPSDVK